MVIGRGQGNISVSSDVQPFYGCCTEVAYMNDGDVLCITTNGIQSAEETMDPIFEPLEGVYERADPGIHSHMMLKEIFDQPLSLSNALSGRIPADGLSAALGGIALKPGQIKNLDRINLIACGSAFYASKIGAHILRRYSTVPVEAYRASEFQASELCSNNTLTIGVSQSGETKDTLDALQEAKIHGSHISSFCNVIGSTNPILIDELPAKAHVWKNRDQLSDLAGDTWNGTASLKIDNADSNLRLLNLNFINNETFFNFSCYESGQ